MWRKIVLKLKRKGKNMETQTDLLSVDDARQQISNLGIRAIDLAPNQLDSIRVSEDGALTVFFNSNAFCMLTAATSCCKNSQS